MMITGMAICTFTLVAISLFSFATITYGFGYSRLSMVSLGWNPSSTKTTLHVSNMGWDNDNFLESLGKGPEAIEKANEEYNRLKDFGMQSSSAYGAGAVAAGQNNNAALRKDQIERIKEQNEKQTGGGGGEMFQKLMERAQQQQQRQPNNTNHPRQTPPPDNNRPPAPSSQPNLPAGFENLSVEAQAALFRQIFNNNNNNMNTPAGVPKPDDSSSNFIPKGMGPDGRRIGRNRDADAIVNSSDVYFAQLKLDSSVRNQARYLGDSEKADQVFADPRIREIKLHVNPHMEEQRKKELEMLETAAEEMILFPTDGSDSSAYNKSDKGVSYKDHLRAKKQGLQTPTTTTKPLTYPEQAPPSTIQTETRVLEVPSWQTTVPAPVDASSPPSKPALATTPAESSTPQPPRFREERASQARVPPAESSPASQTPTGDQRQNIRTLMGLLLKHRGGPGFGSGRLQDPEIQRFDQLVDTILEQLRNEAVESPQKQPAFFSSPSAPQTSAPLMEMMMPQPPIQKVSTPSPSFVGKSSTQASEKMNSMIAAVEGALQLYKNSPPELQSWLVGTIQATLMAALNTCNQVLDSGRDGSSRSLAASPYTDVETETTFSSSMPPPKSISEIVDPGLVTPAPASPTQLPKLSKPQYDGTDENSIFFESVYQKLQAVASNSGKLGLQESVAPAAAESLADDLAKMRALLVQELDAGIPSGNSEGGTSASQRYQDMLAKARAERNDSKFQ